MNQIWTPWRMDYIRSKREGFDLCAFCQIAEGSDSDDARHVIARSAYTFALLNRYPYTYGHTMVIPYAHESSLEDLSTAALADLMLMTNRAMGALREVSQPPAFNIGANIGAAAGALSLSYRPALEWRSQLYAMHRRRARHTRHAVQHSGADARGLARFVPFDAGQLSAKRMPSVRRQPHSALAPRIG